METKNREKVLLIVTGATLVLLLLNWLVIQPLITSWHNRSDLIARLRQQISDGSMLEQRGDELRDRWDKMNTNALSADPAVAERQFFDAFDRWVRVSHVTEGSFKPQLKQTDDNYSVMECHADVTGSYPDILHFIFTLEKDPMGLQVQSLELTSRDDKGTQISLGVDLSGLLTPPPPIASNP